MSLGPGPPLDQSMADDRAVLQVALSAYFASQQFASLGGTYVDRSLVPSALLWVHAWSPLPHFVTWAAVLAWGGCAALAVSFDVLAWRARQRVLACLPKAGETVRLHFAPTPPPPASLLLSHALVPLSGILWAHALRPELLAPSVLWFGSRSWLILVALRLALKRSEIIP